jgi:hypothetical protein
MDKSIKVWVWDDAPGDLQVLYNQGGDENWLVLIPKEIVGEVLEYGVPFWIEAMDSLREPKQFTHDNGDVVFVGSH